MSRRRAAFLAAGIVVILASALQAEAEKTIDEKIDSLFIIAASLDIKYRDSVGPARESIAALGAEAVPHLIEMLGTPHGRERAALEDIFRKIGQPAVPLLNDALLTTDSLRLSRVATMLYYLPDTSSVENLLRVVDKPYYSARSQVIRALGKIGDTRAVPAVRAAMKDTIELVRTNAAVSAGRLGDPALITDLVAAFDDAYYGVRMSAHEALINVPCEVKTAFICGALPSASQAARRHLLTIIAEDTCRYDPSAVAPYLEAEDPLVKSLALRAAFRLDPGHVMTNLEQTADTTGSIILKQTIGDILRSHETKTPANP